MGHVHWTSSNVTREARALNGDQFTEVEWAGRDVGTCGDVLRHGISLWYVFV